MKQFGPSCRRHCRLILLWSWRGRCKHCTSGRCWPADGQAKDLRGSIAARDLRAEQPEGLRQDAVSYSLQALQLFEGMDQQRFIAVLTLPNTVGLSRS